MPSHQEIDQRSLALHKLVADKVRHDERLMRQAHATLTRWYGVASPRTFTYLDAWRRLFDSGAAASLAVVLPFNESRAFCIFEALEAATCNAVNLSTSFGRQQQSPISTKSW